MPGWLGTFRNFRTVTRCFTTGPGYCAELGRTDDSNKQFEELHTKYPKSRFWPDAVYRLAEMAVQKPDHPRAKKLLTELLEFGPGEQMLMHARLPVGPGINCPGTMGRSLAAAGATGTRFSRQPAPAAGRFLDCRSQLPAGQLQRGGGGNSQSLCARVSEKARSLAMAMVPLARGGIFAFIRSSGLKPKTGPADCQELSRFRAAVRGRLCAGRRLYAEGQIQREAREAYGRAIRSQSGGQDQTAAMAQWMIGESYFHQKNYEAAIREYLRLEILYGFPPGKAARCCRRPSVTKCWENGRKRSSCTPGC